MRAVVWFVLLFVVAVVAASTFGANDGLVSFYWGTWRLDMSLNLFVVALLGTCFAIVTVIQGINTLLALPKRAKEWRIAQRDQSAQAWLRDSLAQYFGGRYSRAQKSAERALAIQAETPELAKDNDFTVLGRLLTAGSMHRLQDRAKRDEQLRLALEAAARSDEARTAEEGARLLAAEWALDDRDTPRALELLAALPPGVARRTQALRLRLKGARLAGEPLEALKTARLLAKHQGFSQAAAQGLLRALGVEALDGARDAAQVRRIWQALDAADRRDAFVAARAAVRFSALAETDEARAVLRPFWERLDEIGADERAALALALVPALPGLSVEWLPRLESAVQSFPNEAALAYAVGSALAERQLWGKAKPLLEQAAADAGLTASARRQAWLMLATLAEGEADAARAARYHERAARVG